MNTWYHEYKECKILVWVKGECHGFASYGSIFVITLQCEVKSEINIIFSNIQVLLLFCVGKYSRNINVNNSCSAFKDGPWRPFCKQIVID